MPKPPALSALTILFKNRKVTIVLQVDKDATFTSIADDLLSAIQSTANSTSLSSLDPDIDHVNDLGNDGILPTLSSDILFARPTEPRNLEVTHWEEINRYEDTESTGTKGGKGKGRANNEGKMENTPSSLGLKDGAVLAFRFKSQEDKDGDDLDERQLWRVDIPQYDDDE